jgi:hypothetical protein
MPCNDIKDFQISGKPHRIDVISSLWFMKEHGFEAWLKQQEDTYTCQKCGKLNSAYNLKCRGCGNDPANTFVEVHQAAIIKHLSNTQ